MSNTIELYGLEIYVKWHDDCRFPKKPFSFIINLIGNRCEIDESLLESLSKALKEGEKSMTDVDIECVRHYGILKTADYKGEIADVNAAYVHDGKIIGLDVFDSVYDMVLEASKT